MKNLVELIEKPVFSLKDFCIIGKVTGCLVDHDFKHIAYFLCIDEEAEFLLPFQNIVAEKDVLVVEDKVGMLHPLDVDFTSFKSLLGKEVYCADGTLLGIVKDLGFDSKGGLVELRIEDGLLKPSSIVGVGDAILVKPAQKRKNKRKSVDFVALASTDSPVTILDPSPDMAEQGQTSPTRIISDYNFLLGRMLDDDLLSYDGRLIAYKNTRVTVDVVEKARLAGKLLELTLNSK